MDFVKFLVDYWEYISIALLVILDVVILIVKRIKFNVELPSNSYEQLVQLVNEAEVQFGSGHGSEKLQYVVKKYFQQNNISCLMNVPLLKYVRNIVEIILSTPTKKGGFGREEIK